jgi:hypothetical protein
MSYIYNKEWAKDLFSFIESLILDCTAEFGSGIISLLQTAYTL